MNALLRRRSRDDEGTVLILALAFLALFGLVVGTILGLASTNLRTTTVVRDRAAATYTADGAVDGAINAARSQSSVGVAGSSSTCFSVPTGVLNASTQVDVKCTGLTGSGATTSPFPANASTPAKAILTPTGGTDTGEGVVLNTSVARVRGPVSVAHTLAEGVGTLTASPAAYSPITAEACTGTGIVTPTPTCSGTGSSDPGYAPTVDIRKDVRLTGVLQTVPTLATVPACNANKVASFSPGIYTNLTALNTLMTSCAGGLLYFKPGQYYFDFTDATGTTGAGHDWTLNDVNAEIVGGTPAGFDPTTYVATGGALLPSPSSDATSTTSACDTAAPGVLFVFGNDSRFTLANGHVQLCAYTTSATAQHLAVWSPAVGTTLSGSTADIGAASNPTDSTAAGGVKWTNAQNGSIIGTQLSNVTANATVPSTLTEAASQYTVPTAQIPAGATIISLTARVFETLTGTGKSTLTFKPPTTGTGAPATPIPVQTVHDCTAGCSGPTYSATTETDITIPLTAASQTAEVNGMGWVYSVTGATSYVDGIDVSVDYTYPVRAAAGVVLQHPYSPTTSTTDAVWSVAAALATDRPVMAVHGTVYAPKAAVSFSETGVADCLVDRGIIARDVYLALLAPAAAYTGPHIAIPAQPTTVQPRVVVFTAQRSGVDLLRAEVTFTDSTGTVDGTVPKVLTWSLQ